MTHPFETEEKPYARRLKMDTLLEGMSTKRSKVCLAVLKPAIFPNPPHPTGKDVKPYVIPSHSLWFEYGKIHRIEEIQFPELKNNEEFTKEYVEMRDKMVKLFRLYPTKKLTVSVARHIVGGNATFVQKIHNFLSDWGLINFTNAQGQSGELTREGAILRDEFSPIYDNKNISSPFQRFPMQCTLCKCDCSEGHFISIKYPGVILCTRCFSNTKAFEQIGAQYPAFEFRSNFQSQMKVKNVTTECQKNLVDAIDKDKKYGEQYEAQRKMINPYDKYSLDWQQISMDVSKANQMQNKECNFSQLDCLTVATRLKEGDFTAPKTVFNHDFHHKAALDDLIGFNEAPEPMLTSIELPPKKDWDALENSIDEIAEATKIACLGHGNKDI